MLGHVRGWAKWRIVVYNGGGSEKERRKEGGQQATFELLAALFGRLHIIPVLVGCTTLVAAAASDASSSSTRKGLQKEKRLNLSLVFACAFLHQAIGHLLSRFAFLRGRRD